MILQWGWGGWGSLPVMIAVGVARARIVCGEVRWYTVVNREVSDVM